MGPSLLLLRAWEDKDGVEEDKLFFMLSSGIDLDGGCSFNKRYF